LQSTNPLTSSTSSTSTTTSSTTTSSNGLTLNDLANLNARNFAVSIPSTSVQFLMNDSRTKVIQQPQLRAVDGQKSTLKIGQRVPVATGSFQPGIGGVGINPLVNTQFNYIDVGVNVDMTPHIHRGNEVSMKILFEISSVVSYNNIGGINQPVIGQDRIEHEIRIREGEVSLIGGFMENSLTESNSGLPWITQVPILKYLFGQNQKERIENEIVFVLKPHIVRTLDVTEYNTRAVDIGTANAIQITRQPPAATPAAPAAPTPAPPAPAKPQTPASAPPSTPTLVRPQGAASTPAPQPPAQSSPPAAPAARSSTTPPAGAAEQKQVQQARANVPPAVQQLGPMGAGPVISFDPASLSPKAGSTFTVDIRLNGAQNIASVPVLVKFDPKILQLLNVSNGDLLSKDGQAVALVHREDTGAGTIQMTASRPPSTPGISGNGTVFTLTFLAKSPGQCILSVNRAVLRDPTMQATTASGSQAVVSVN
jgi:general secretion pathway protein D